MSFERININVDRERVASKQSSVRSGVDNLGTALQAALDQLEKSYAEIDRLTAENVELKHRIETLESAKHQLAFERDKLAAKLDELREKQNEPARPRWTPPTALKDGEYRWNAANGEFRDASGIGWSSDASLKLLKDWMRPPVAGRWRITAGKAEYLDP